MTMNQIYNMDCVEGARQNLSENSVDLIITDPPYGINGDSLHKHYNRDEGHVIDGYIEVPADQYAEYSIAWISEAERVLRPGGSIYVVSGYSNLRDVLNALAQTSLIERNHLIWKYNFGVFTKKKYVSSHYHILYYVKPGKNPVFNTNIRFGPAQKNNDGRAQNYLDREDVWVINREYKPGQKKNKNELPTELLVKMIQYSSNEGDTVCDFFLGGFSTARVAVGLNRNIVGFELSKTAYDHNCKSIDLVQPGHFIGSIPQPEEDPYFNQGKKWSDEDLSYLSTLYEDLRNQGRSKKDTLKEIGQKVGRGYFSVLNALKKLEV